MHRTVKPIDVFVGEANDGHAELVEASFLESGIVNNLHRGRDGDETFALVRGVWRDCTNVTDTPSLILLDCGLPRIGGIGVLRVLRNDVRYSRIPVVMMTRAYDRQQAEKCRRLGCEAYITKWTVFLGLPGFVRTVRILADKAIRIASHGLSDGRSHGCSSGSFDLRSMSDTARIARHRQERIRKEVRDGSATP